MFKLRLFAVAATLAAACSHEVTSPTPALTSVSPDLVCNGSAQSAPDGVSSVALAGSDFTPTPSSTLTDPRRLLLPKITLEPTAAIPGGTLAAAPVAITDDPADPANSRVHWTSELAMSFDVAPADHLPTGVFGVTVTNPDGSHASTLDQVLAVLPAPIVAMVKPPAICDDQADQSLTITGANFLVFDGATPSVTLGTKTYSSTFAASDCAPVTGTFAEANVQLCTAITISVPQGDFDVTAATTLPLVVTNPPPADCDSASSPVDVTIDPPPEVDSIVPATVCEGGSQLTITGQHFQSGAAVAMTCGATTFDASNVTVTPDGTQLGATFGGGAVPGDTCTVTVTNPDGCEDRPLPHHTVTVVAGPIVFFVDPPVAFNGINTRVTIYATTIAQPLPADAVQIVPAGATSPVTQLAFNTVVGHPNRLQAIVPLGQAPGVYDLILNDHTGCQSIFPNAITVTATTTVTIQKVRPPFGVTTEDTSIEIFRDTAAASPNNQPFLDPPRVFLNPTNPQATDVAVEVESVAFLDGDRLTGVVPAGTPVHAYDVVVVNPDGTVGVLASSLANGYTETATDPPRIDTATPASIVAATNQNVTLGGRGFTAGNTVTLACVDSTGTAIPAPGVVTGTPSCVAGSCTEGITIDGSTLPAGAVCVVTLTNLDGLFGDFSAIGVTNSSLNLNSPHAGPDLNVGRRAPSAAAGNATSSNRFVYALGGDDGTAAGALASVEFASVDPFGTIGAFAVQPTPLRAPRTLAGSATVGRYIYLVGGNAGAGAVTTAERALILSPRETPVIDDVDLALQVAGLEPGEYHYRVSAVFKNTDSDNPGGESLASDEFTLRIPSFPGKKIAVTLVWKAPVDSLGAPLPNVAGYRVYRTAADGAPESEVLLGAAAITTAALTFTDDGSLTPGTAVPLPLGSTGTFAALPSLAVAREGVAVAVASDPVTPGVFYVYALGGRSDATTAPTSYELLTVTTAADGRQTASAAWTTGLAASNKGRWQAGAWTVDATVAPAYTGGPFVFFGGGLTAASAAANTVEAMRVTAGGQLAAFVDAGIKDFSATQAGYGVCAANGQLFTFGGKGAVPSTSATSATLTSPPPNLALNSWNSEGLQMTHGRYLLGSAVQSSFIFLLGGQTDEPSPASKTTELAIW